MLCPRGLAILTRSLKLSFWLKGKKKWENERVKERTALSFMPWAMAMTIKEQHEVQKVWRPSHLLVLHCLLRSAVRQTLNNHYERHFRYDITRQNVMYCRWKTLEKHQGQRDKNPLEVIIMFHEIRNRSIYLCLCLSIYLSINNVVRSLSTQAAFCWQWIYMGKFFWKFYWNNWISNTQVYRETGNVITPLDLDSDFLLSYSQAFCLTRIYIVLVCVHSKLA